MVPTDGEATYDRVLQHRAYAKSVPCNVIPSANPQKRLCEVDFFRIKMFFGNKEYVEFNCEE